MTRLLIPFIVHRGRISVRKPSSPTSRESAGCYSRQVDSIIYVQTRQPVPRGVQDPFVCAFQGWLATATCRPHASLIRLAKSIRPFVLGRALHITLTGSEHSSAPPYHLFKIGLFVRFLSPQPKGLSLALIWSAASGREGFTMPPEATTSSISSDGDVPELAKTEKESPLCMPCLLGGILVLSLIALGVYFLIWWMTHP